MSLTKVSVPREGEELSVFGRQLCFSAEQGLLDAVKSSSLIEIPVIALHIKGECEIGLLRSSAFGQITVFLGGPDDLCNHF